MCMYFNRYTKVSKKFRNGKFTAYKVFNRFGDEKHIYPINYKTQIPVEITKDGMYVSDRKSKNLSRNERESTYEGVIYKGIHVYLDRVAAEDIAGCDDVCVVVPVVCDKNDLVKFGHQNGDDQAVFMKVKIIHKKHQKMCITK